MGKELNIAILVPSLKVGGGTRRLLEIGKHLSERKHNVTLYIYRENFKCFELWEPKLTLKPLVALQEDSTDVLLASWSRYPEWVYNINVPYKLWLMQAYYERLDKTFLEDASFIKVANSSHMYEVGQRFGAEPIKAYGGINLDEFSDQGLSRCNILYRDYDNVLQDNVFNKIQNKVRRLSQVLSKDIPILYNESLVFVTTEKGKEYAGFCNTAMEAMACRTPVIIDAAASARDIAANGRSSLVSQKTAFVYRTYEEAQDLINAMLNNELSTADIVDNAYEHIKQFTWDKVTDNIEQIWA